MTGSGPWWRQRWVAVVAGLVVVVALTTVIAIAATGDDDGSAPQEQATEQPSLAEVDSSLFPQASQREWENAVDTTCTRFRQLYRDRDIVGLSGVAVFLRTSSRATIIKNGWHYYEGGGPIARAELAAMEHALEGAAFTGPAAPCRQYEDLYYEAQPARSALD